MFVCGLHLSLKMHLDTSPPSQLEVDGQAMMLARIATADKYDGPAAEYLIPTAIRIDKSSNSSRIILQRRISDGTYCGPATLAFKPVQAGTCGCLSDLGRNQSSK